MVYQCKFTVNFYFKEGWVSLLMCMGWLFCLFVHRLFRIFLFIDFILNTGSSLIFKIFGFVSEKLQIIFTESKLSFDWSIRNSILILLKSIFFMDSGYWALYSISNLGIRLDTVVLISCSTLIFTRYLLFVTANSKISASQKHGII